MLVGAAVLGIIAVFLARLALSPSAPQAVAAPVTTSVAAAAVALSFGDKITKENLRLVQLPRDAVPEGAFRTILAAYGDGTRVAQRAVALNEVLVPASISGSGNRLSAAGAIGPGMRAASVVLSETTGVAGLIAPGDHVDVYVTRTPPDKTPRFDVVLGGPAAAKIPSSADAAILANAIGLDGKPVVRRAPQASVPTASLVRAASNSGEDAPKEQPITDLLLQDIRVLAVGQNTNVTTDKPELSRSATLELTPAQVAKLTLGQSVGTLTLALRPLADKDRTAVASLHVADLHEGTARVAVVSTAKRRVVKPVEPPQITVIRAGLTTSYAVPGQ